MSNTNHVLPLALMRIEGLGQVAANLLVDRCASAAELMAAPREQLIIWMKGVPSAAAIAARIQDGSTLAAAMDDEAREVAVAEARRIKVLTCLSEAWPRSLAAMPAQDRPIALWAYGHLDLLSRSGVAIIGKAPITDQAFSAAQIAGQKVHARGGVVLCGTAPGFDVPFHRRAATEKLPLIMVAGSGLSSIHPGVRPAVSGAINGGGLMVSPFPMDHGPFDHDLAGTMLLMAALSVAVVAAEPEEQRSVRAASKSTKGPILDIPRDGLSHSQIDAFLDALPGLGK